MEEVIEQKPKSKWTIDDTMAWTATGALTIATAIRAFSPNPFWDLIFTGIGLGLWGIVAFRRTDRPLLITNAFGVIIVAYGIIRIILENS